MEKKFRKIFRHIKDEVTYHFKFVIYIPLRIFTVMKLRHIKDEVTYHFKFVIYMPLRIFTVMKLRRKLAQFNVSNLYSGGNRSELGRNTHRLARSFSWFSSVFLSFRTLLGIIQGLGWRSG